MILPSSLIPTPKPTQERSQELILPLVSVIIVNYNYNDYINRALQSVNGQTYPEIEIIIVDDKSTDESVATIDCLCKSNEKVKKVSLLVNSGQSIASLHGFSTSLGSYVLFLDADDILLPECIEAHIYAHMSSRIPVAFTSVDVLNNAAGRDTNMSHDGFSQYVKSRRGRRSEEIRCVDQSMSDSWFGSRPPAIRPEQIHFVLPPHVDPWVWSPTSANCYRRDAVTLLLKEPGLDHIRWGTDAYLIRPLSGLFGSILIDRPLVRYIIHANNKFVKGAPLNQWLFFDTRQTSDDIRQMARTGFERLMSDVQQNGHLYSNPSMFFRAMEALGECWPGPRRGEKPGEYYTKQLLANRDTLTRVFGEEMVDHVLRERHLGLLTRLRHFLKSYRK